MSFIHDALRRSQQERDQGATVGLEAGSVAPGTGHGPHVPAPRLLYGLPVILALLVGLWWLVTGSETEPASSVASIAAAPAPRAADAAVTAPNSTAQTAQLPLSTRRTYAELPFAWELQAPLKQRLAALAVTIHVYAQSPVNRVLFLNDREYRQGDRMPDGVEVVEIVPEGAVLSLGETYFRLPRPR